MRISKVSVERLFNNPKFNYDIELNRDPPITILHGRNGSGKTTIFRMLYGLFNAEYFSFFACPFEVFHVLFDDQTHLSVTRSFEALDREDLKLEMRFSKLPKEPYEPDIDLRIRFRDRPSRYNFYLGSTTAETLSRLADVDFENYTDSPILETRNVNRRRWAEQQADCKWLSDLASEIDVQFISTSRLRNRAIESGYRVSSHRLRRQPIIFSRTIEENSEDLKKQIGAVKIEANRTDNRLSREFPSNIVKSVELTDTDSWVYERVVEELKVLQQEWEKLEDIGLRERGTELPVEHYQDRTLGIVLRIYIENSRTSLKDYRDLASKITLLKQIVDEMLSDKEMSVDEQGYKIRNSVDSFHELPLSALSSGEQHMIVLMYNLLFHEDETENDKDAQELLLIDEPEISLHIAWQKHFVNHLEKITELSPFDIIIATHSPHIVNARWDLEVPLAGVPNREQ